MKIEHVAIWVNDLEVMKGFYETYFNGKANNKYQNAEKKSLGSRESVNEMTVRLKNDGYRHISGPHVTGDGYYESVIEDPEGNLIELTV